MKSIGRKFPNTVIRLKLIPIVFVQLISTPLKTWSEEAPGSRMHWLLNPGYYIARNQAMRAELEECVFRLGLVDHVRIIQDAKTTSISISITNVSELTITGLIVQPRDEALERVGLDGRALITFDPVPPGGSTTYTEEIDQVIEEFGSETSVELIAWDIVNGSGEQVVRDIFWSQWPTVSSEGELERARQVLCGG